MQIIKIIFFGSTSDSVLVLEKLFHSSSVNCQLSIVAIVTQPAKPIGRTHIVTPTPVEKWAKEHTVTVLTFANNPLKPWVYADEQQVIDALQPIGADMLVSASYGVKIPWATIQAAKYGGINIHPSILPHWRGADPVPWAILSGDHQIGVSVVTLSQTFDEGKILAQEKIPITPTDTSDPLRTKLFTLGATLLTDALPLVFSGKMKPKDMHMPKPKPPYARKFTRDDGFEPWDTLKQSMEEGIDADRIDRKYRALHPWPGVWTMIEIRDERKVIRKRLKILHMSRITSHVSLDLVQLEGKKPIAWEQFISTYV